MTALTNTQGILTNRSEYDAFGLQSSNGATANAIGYTGQRLDNETGLMALGNGERYYSPVYARFIQQDSWLGDNQMPQSLNRFAYGYNNPFKYTDPSGNQPEGDDKEAVEQFRRMRQALDNEAKNRGWWENFITYSTMGAVETGYGGVKFVKEFVVDSVTQPIYGKVDQVKDAYYNATGTDYKDRSYWSKTYQGEQKKILGGMSVMQAKWETLKSQVYSASTLGLGPLVEKVGGNALAYYDGRIDLTEYNIGQGEALAEAGIMYAMARGGRAVMEKLGAAKPMTFRESLKNLKTEFSTLKSNIKDVGNKLTGRSELSQLSSDANKRLIASASEGSPSALKDVSTLTKKQLAVHESLTNQGSIAQFSKRSVSMGDLRAIGQVTGDEYAMYTQGSRRTIIRGYGNEVYVPTQEMADALSAGKYGRWSGHTHPPGYGIQPSVTDRARIPVGQKASAVWGDEGVEVFGRTPADDSIIQMERRRKMNERLYGK